MSATLVDHAENGLEKSFEVQTAASSLREDREELRQAAARLLGQGFSTKQVATALGTHLVPDTRRQTPQSVVQGGMRKLRRWRQEKEFRDLMWEHALTKLDLQSPDILQGVAGKAKRGRVDAARLALELTGRHTPKGDQVITNVTVQIANVPRPERMKGV